MAPGSSSAAAPPDERPRNGAAEQVGEQPGDDVEAGLRQQQAAAGEVSNPSPRSQAGEEELETLLHVAVRKRNDKLAEVKKLQRFAKTPDINDMPPLYLAIFLGYSDMAELLIKTFGSDLSYEGPNGQNVLHVAALRSRDLTKIVLDAQEKFGWMDLRNVADGSGSTPLHFAASVGVKGVTSLLVDGDTTDIMKKADNNGMCPIHIAASVGAMDAIHALDGETALRDNDMGRTFLHVAVENKKTNVVKLVCRKSSPVFRNILNMKDKDGNTALHLAVQNRDESSFSHLIGNRYVELNHVNKDGHTPLDIASKIKIENDFASRKNPTEWMVRVLAHSGAHFSARRRDMKYRIITPPKDQRADDSSASSSAETTRPQKKKKTKKAAELNESVLVASALIATVTFAAAFTMPGSYKTEGHRAGTPALASRYGFKVFVIADILAFYCSVAATFSLAEYGNRDDVDPLVRHIYAQRAVRFFHVALKSVIVAFALGVSVVMWDISVVTGIIVAIATSALVLYGNEALAYDLRFMRVMHRRFGFSRAWRLCPSTSAHLDWNSWRLRSFFATLAWNIAKLFGTYVFIFLVAYIAQLKQKSGI